MTGAAALQPPFPYYGSKRRVAAAVWERLGDPDVFSEPMLGSGAVMLARPGGAPRRAHREVGCDRNAFIVNFYRATVHDAEAVARHAAWPSFHHDLAARHRALLDWGAAHGAHLAADPDWHDARMAGWWVWGQSLWIGTGWCEDDTPDRVPHTQPRPGGGRGTAALRAESRPFAADHLSGSGVSHQALQGRQIPLATCFPGGPAASAQATAALGDGATPPAAAHRDALAATLRAVADRLHGVVLFNRDWTSAVTPTVLCDAPSSPATLTRAVFLDPPYRLDGRSRRLYPSDRDSDPERAARDSYDWALAHGERYRVAYCCTEGDFPVPKDWSAISASYGGIKRADRRHRRDLVMFSPACRPPAQASLDFAS